MKIQGPLVIDVSLWDDHLNVKELVDGGVVSVIVGLYRQTEGGKVVLNSNCRRICDQVAAEGKMLMQAYFYVHPEQDPIKQADWFTNIIFVSGYPVRFIWADCEDYSAPMTSTARALSYQRFTERIKANFPHSGVYTNSSFIYDYAPNMNKWLGSYPAWVAHYGRQPSKKIMMTWEQLKTDWLPNYNIFLGLPNYNIFLAPGQTNVVGHQFTGDRCLLPGVYSKYSYLPWWPNKGRLPLDVSVFTQSFIDSIRIKP